MTIPMKPQVPLLPEPRHPVPPAPIHPLAALATLVLDNVFGIFEIVDPFLLILTSVSVGVIGAVTTMFVQRYLAKDGWGASVAKGLVMGIIAGVPFQVAGTGRVSGSNSPRRRASRPLPRIRKSSRGKSGK